MNWMLFHLCIVTFAEFIYCDDEFADALNISCGSNSVAMTIFSYAAYLNAYIKGSIMVCVVNQVFITLFFQNSMDEKKDALNSENVLYLIAFQMYRVLNAIMCVVR